MNIIADAIRNGSSVVDRKTELDDLGLKVSCAHKACRLLARIGDEGFLDPEQIRGVASMCEMIANELEAVEDTLSRVGHDICQALNARTTEVDA